MRSTAEMPTLQTDRLRLRAFEPSDAPALQDMAGHPEVASTTLTIPHPYGDGVAEAWISNHAGYWEERRLLVLAVTTPADGLVGAMSLRLRLDHGRGELAYWIGVPFWNRGYATEAARAMMEYGFGELELNRIEALHIMRNPSSGRVMEKLGLKREGVLREYLRKDDVYEDTVYYGMLRADFIGG
jgi:RimJ/RimL family protein N-acetyltransferase